MKTIYKFFTTSACAGLILLITSCATIHLAWDYDANLRDLKQGTTPDEVIDKIGKPALRDFEGDVEIWGYRSNIDADTKCIIWLRFVNGKLYSKQTVPVHQHPDSDN